MGVLKSICFNGMCNEIPDMLSFEVVDQLPATGTGGIIYLVPNADAYDEYVWTDDGFFKIGTTNEVSVEEIEREIRELKETKANIDGYYPNLHVGTSDQLLADTYTTDEEPYHYRQTPSHAGTREMDEIVGGSVVWNQLLPFNLGSGTATVDGVTYTYNSDGTISISGTATANVNILVASWRWNIPIEGHKYLWTTYGFKQGMNVRNGDLGYFVYGGDVSTVREGNILVGVARNWTWDSPINIQVINGTTVDAKVSVMCFDLTQMFGATIADYIYNLEQTTAGAGVAFFRKYFPEEYYAYDAGTMRSVEGLVSHDTVGFNLWDGSIVNGYTSDTNGELLGTLYGRSTDYIQIIPNVDYYIYTSRTTGMWGAWYDKNKTYINGISGYNRIATAPANAKYCRLTLKRNEASESMPDEFCINISDTDKNGTYEPYEKHSYPLDNSVTLRGIPQLVDGQLKFDGDTYSADGVVTRRYGIVDLGTLNYTLESTSETRQVFITTITSARTTSSATEPFAGMSTKFVAKSINDSWVAGDIAWRRSGAPDIALVTKSGEYASAAAFKTAMSGVYLVYELATPTTEQAEPYQSLQICSPYGTEEYVSTSIVPVGHYTKYPTDLKGIVEQIADAPSADGTYTLKATVSNGVVTYSWESA